jgi:CBS domain-containing protein
MNKARIDNLRSVQNNLTVDLIYVEKESFISCKIGQDITSLMRKHKDLDAFVVLDEVGKVLGIYERPLSPEPHFAKLSRQQNDRITVRAGDPIYRAMHCLEQTSVAFVEKRGKVVGLITRSDLEKIPARIAIFTECLTLEAGLVNYIKSRTRDLDAWMKCLVKHFGKSSADDIISELLRHRDPQELGDDILALSFPQKIKLAVALGLRAEIKTVLAELTSLRNDVAHDHPKVPTKSIPGLVRLISEYVDDLRAAAPEVRK